MFNAPESDQFKRYLFEYRHEGAEWALEVRARDLNDAKARLAALPWSQYRGEIAASGSIPLGDKLLSWRERISRWFRF